MKTIEEKKELVNKYYNNANKHVFKLVNYKIDYFFNIGIKKNKETNEEFVYLIEIKESNNIKITILKSWESHKQEHKHKWFPKDEKIKAIKKFKHLKNMLLEIEEFIEREINSEIDERKITYVFKYDEKFEKNKISLSI